MALLLCLVSEEEKDFFWTDEEAAVIEELDASAVIEDDEAAIKADDDEACWEKSVREKSFDKNRRLDDKKRKSETKPAKQMRRMQLQWPKILLSASTASHSSSSPQPAEIIINDDDID